MKKMNNEAKSKEKDILLVPIKGLSYSQDYYKRFGLRPIVDIDLCVKKEDMEQGVELLERMGYQKYLAGGTEGYWRKNQCHLEFIREEKGERNIKARNEKAGPYFL